MTRHIPPFEDSQQEIFITFPSSFASRHSSFLLLSRHYTPPLNGSPQERSM
ncbi:hypothetical protein HMPREF9072_00766 [Capnocytophaga sp. oral taxon 324 str. F0483]|nr:hypothetical protein HMPREF9072_00766 [Capnocytophaga sp. oral taxon 324 str. F0483]